MEVEVVAPSPAPDTFNFDSNCSSPYITAPSSPQRLGNFFFSAPTSPTRSTSPFLLLIDDDLPRHSSASSSSSVPFLWEEKPGVLKSKPTNSAHQDNDDVIGNEDFEFNFSGYLDRTSLTADELFDGGKIRPLKPPPSLNPGDGNSSPASNSNLSSPRSRISQGKKIVQGAFSPRHQKRGFDPFAAAMDEGRKSEGWREDEKNRGRERTCGTTSGRKGSRSLSPLRVSDIMGGDSVSEDFSQTGKGVSSSTSYSKPTTPTSLLLSSISFAKGYRKWRLKDFLLFRSASEGRATDKDPLRKYTILSKKARAEEDVKYSSFRSSEGSGTGSKSSRRRGSAVSAHELHYTVNRAAAEEMKKKTFLPYKQGLLGCLGFNPGMHGISRGIGSFTRP